MTKRALILGIGGQDGSYLADELIERRYIVYGLYRRSSYDNLRRIEHVRERVNLVPGDLLDPLSLTKVLEQARPDEIYNVADQDHVGFSMATPSYSMSVTAGGVANVLEAVFQHRQDVKVFQPISSTIFAPSKEPLTESSPLAPASPYAVAKAAALYLSRHYRREHGLKVYCGIMLNHDSPRRGKDYLLQKICRHREAEASVLNPCLKPLRIYNPNGIVDVGFAGDYMRGVVDMLEKAEPDDYVMSSSDPVAVRQLVDWAGVKNVYYQDGVDLPPVVGDSSKARAAFGFAPMTPIITLIQDIVRAEERY